MANFSFTPSYQDYLAANPQNNGGSEGGQGTFSGFTEAQWNALSDADKWRNVGSGLALAQSDPRYAAIAQQLGVTNGGLLNVGYKPQSVGINSQSYVNPNAVLQGNDVFASAHSNLTPFAQKETDSGNWLHQAYPGLLMVAAILSAGAASSAAGLAGADAGGAAGLSGSSALTTGGIGTDISAGSAGVAGGASGVAGASGGGFDANGVWHDVPQMDPVQAPTLNPMGPDPTPLSTAPSGGGFDANGVWHDVPTMQNVQPGLLNPMGTDATPLATTGGNSWIDSAKGLLGKAGTWAENNPLRALGLLQTAYGLVHHPGTPGGNGGSGNGSKGGSGGSPGNFNLPQQQFYVNPYIQAQINRGYGQ